MNGIYCSTTAFTREPEVRVAMSGGNISIHVDSNVHLSMSPEAWAALVAKVAATLAGQAVEE